MMNACAVFPNLGRSSCRKRWATFEEYFWPAVTPWWRGQCKQWQPWNTQGKKRNRWRLQRRKRQVFIQQQQQQQQLSAAGQGQGKVTLIVVRHSALLGSYLRAVVIAWCVTCNPGHVVYEQTKSRTVAQHEKRVLLCNPSIQAAVKTLDFYSVQLSGPKQVWVQL